MAVNMQEVAQEAGVSRTTASIVLNNTPTGRVRVSEQVRNRVLTAARQLDYHPHGVAQGLAVNKTHNVGVAIHDLAYLHELYFALMISEIGAVLGSHDYNLQFTTTSSDDRSEVRHQNLFFLKKVDQKRLDGVILIDQAVDDKTITNLKGKVPFVLIDRYIPDANCVLTDYEKGMRIATEHLINLGHTRIAVIVESLRYNKIVGLLKGYRLALGEYRLSYEGSLVRGVKESHMGQDQVMLQLLSLPCPPTAVVTSSELVALGAMRSIKDKGLRVPQDMSIIAFNDTLLSAAVEPPLSAVRVPLQQMANLAAELLVRLMNDEELAEPVIVLPPELVIRDSCSRVNA